MLVEEAAHPEGTWPDKEATDQRETQTTACQSLRDNHVSAAVQKTELCVLQAHFSLRHPTRALCLHARSPSGALELSRGPRGGIVLLARALARAAGICSASVLHRFARGVSHSFHLPAPAPRQGKHKIQNERKASKDRHYKTLLDQHFTS